MRRLSFPLLSFLFLFTQCYTPQWTNDLSSANIRKAPAAIAQIFQAYPNGIMNLEANSPGYSYDFDIGEKDAIYDNPQGFLSFDQVNIELLETMPEGTVLTNISFVDAHGNKARVENFDLMRLVPKFETSGDMLYSEVLLEEFDRFGVVFRKEHQEFSLDIQELPAEFSQSVAQTTRMGITNNCLEATKWEMNLTSEDYSDFSQRLKDEKNLNQNKILSHCWFYLNVDLYEALQKYKNPHIEQNYFLPYDSLSDLAENSLIVYEDLRYPLGKTLKTKTLEIGHQSNRKLEPVDVEEFYKWQFGLFLNRKEDLTYSTILEEPVQIARFSNAGFYNAETPNIYDYGFLKYLDQVKINSIDAPDSDCIVEIKLTGDYAPYEIVIGNIDLAFPDEQKLAGLLFGYNTYPKSRRYNSAQSTIFYDPDDFPERMKPYVILLDKKTGKWVNNQKKGVEKIYLSYESTERDVLQVYLLSYERVTPVWVGRIKLPNDAREAIRIRRRLYNY